MKARVKEVDDINQSKRVEDALRVSEERYRSLFEHMLDGLAHCRMIFEQGRPQDFIYLEVNKVFEKLTGLKNVTGKRVTEVIPGIRQSNPELFEIYGRVALTGQAEQFETYLEPLKAWLEVSVYSTEKECFVAVFRNITERKQAEDASHRSREEFKDLFDNAPVGFHEIDAEGRIVRINNTQLKMLGYAANELLGQFVWKISGDEELSRQAALAKLAGEPPPAQGFERMFRRKDGSTFPVWIHDRLLKRDDGTVIGIRAGVEDITDHKRMEGSLNYERDLWQTLLDNSPDKLYFKDAQSRFVKVSRAMLIQFGVESTDAMAGKTDFDFFDVSHARPAFEDEQEIIRTGRPLIDKEEREEWNDGRVTWVSSTKLPWRDGTGKIVGTMGISRDITERKRAESALDYERILLRTLLDHSPDNIYFKDTQSRFVKCSTTQARHFGLNSPDELAGKTDFDFYPESHARPRYDDEQEIIRTGRPLIDKEEREEWKPGHVTWVSSTKMPWFDAAGKIVGIIGISRDITAHKEAELAVLASEKRYRQLFDLAADAVVLVDLETHRYMDVNKATQHLYGYSREEFLQMTPEDVSTEPGKTHAHITEGDAYVPLRWHRKKNGDKIALEIMANQIDYKGRPTALVTLRDITARKLAEESQTRLATAVEQAAETIVITDTKGTILYANPAFEKSTGYTRAEALGQNPRILKSGRQDDEFYRQMWDVLKRGEVWQGHFINKRKDGKPYEEEATISPVRDNTGAVINFVAVKRDVTNEVQLEAQFRQLQKMEAVGQLASGVAHDFNNILAVIQIQSELLKAGGNLSPEQSGLADEIGISTQRAATLTRQLLLFGRKQTLQPRDLDLNQSINDMTKLLRRALGENIELQFKFAMQGLFVRADGGMLDQVLINLAVNSRDAMRNGGRLVIETSAVEFDESVREQSAHARPGPYVCLSVSDTGCGIPPENLPRIFEPFFTTKDVGKGTGLGLATVFGIVQQHQGWINAYSEVGQGTTFRIYLPRLARLSGQKPDQPASTAVRGGNETILLVEDDMLLCVSVLKTLLKLGYRVFEAVNGVEALAVWAQHHDEIHLLLTDMVMPGGISGRELAERLLKENPKLKVIYASGYSPEIAGKDFHLEEGVNFLTKPFQTQKLAQTVRQKLDSEPGSSPDQSHA